MYGCAGCSRPPLTKRLAAELVTAHEADIPADIVEMAKQQVAGRSMAASQEELPGVGHVAFPAEPLLLAARTATAEAQVCPSFWDAGQRET